MAPLLFALGGIALLGVSIVSGVLLLVGLLVRHIYGSVELPPCAHTGKPTTPAAHEHDSRFNPLFHVLPQLRHCVPHVHLGTYPVPVNSVRAANERQYKIHLKREDLSSTLYGGNKVRSLEFLLAAARARLSSSGRIVAIGAPGSNQCIATAVHAHALRLPCTCLWVGDEAPDRDNALNLMSCLSFPISAEPLFARGLRGVADFVQQCADAAHIVLMPGGAHPVGCLGNAGAALELAMQIRDGTMPSPQRIYLAFGSSCTLCGLVVGIAVARKQDIAFHSLADLEIHAVMTHHAVEKLPSVILNWALQKLIRDTCELLRVHAGVDVAEDATRVFERVVIRRGYAVKYGKATPKTKAAAKRFSEVELNSASTPWICSTFTGKSGAVLLDDLDADDGELHEKTILFWCSKSAVQPRGGEAIWKKANALMDVDTTGKLKQWLVDCGVQSEHDFQDHLQFVVE